MNVFYFVYCCFYRWSERINGTAYPNRHSASMMMSFAMLLVAGAIFSIVVLLFGIDDLSGPFWRVGAILFCVFLFWVVHRNFSAGERFTAALREFDASSSPFRRAPGLLVALIVGSALTLLFTTWILIAKF